jgi:hypothetical protein
MAGDTKLQHEVANMASKFLPAVVAVVLAFGCPSAQAIPANGASLANYPAVEGFAHQGSYLVDFVEGRVVTAEPRGVAATATTTTEDRAARYASQSAVLTIVFLALVAMALAGSAAIGKVRRTASRYREPAPRDAWKQALLDMLEADLTNLDSMTHGFSGR